MKLHIFIFFILLSTNVFSQLDEDGRLRLGSAATIDGRSPGIVRSGFHDHDFLYDDEYINHYGFGFHGFQDGSSSFANPINSYLSGFFGIDLFTSGENRLRIHKTGELSIGTTNRNTNYLLNVNGSVLSKGLTVDDGTIDVIDSKIKVNRANDIDGNSPGFVYRSSNDDFLYDDEYINQYGFGFHGFQDHSVSYDNPTNSYISGHFGVDFFTGSNHRMRIDRDGRVGIGTETPDSDALLTVAGSIHSRKLTIEANAGEVPDYVFEADYDLRSLEETKEYIQKHKHLPEIPSASEIGQSGGFDVGDMNLRLLKKIEEMTLHQIDMMEEMQKMKAEIDALKSK